MLPIEGAKRKGLTVGSNWCTIIFDWCNYALLHPTLNSETLNQPQEHNQLSQGSQFAAAWPTRTAAAHPDITTA